MNQQIKNALGEIARRQEAAGLTPNSSKSLAQVMAGDTGRAGYRTSEIYKDLPKAEIPREEMAAKYGITILDTLTQAHMTPAQKAAFTDLLFRVRQWRALARTESGRAFVLAGQQVGIGKTHIAQAVADSFGHFVTAEGRPEPEFHRNSIFITAQEAMAAFSGAADGEDGNRRQKIISRKHQIVVLDDIGREGLVPFVRQDAETQAKEKADRYYVLIDYCYQHSINLFITTNFSVEQLREFLGRASWSRLRQMAPEQHFINLVGFSDFREIEHAISSQEIAEMDSRPELHQPNLIDAPMAGVPTGDL